MLVRQTGKEIGPLVLPREDRQLHRSHFTIISVTEMKCPKDLSSCDLLYKTQSFSNAYLTIVLVY